MLLRRNIRIVILKNRNKIKRELKIMLNMMILLKNTTKVCIKKKFLIIHIIIFKKEFDILTN